MTCRGCSKDATVFIPIRQEFASKQGQGFHLFHVNEDVARPGLIFDGRVRDHMMRIREGGKPLGRSGFSLFEFLVVRNAWAKASRFGSSHSAGISAVFAAGLMHFISYSNDPSVFLYLGNK